MQIINPGTVMPPQGGYSQGTRAGNLIFVAGQVGVDAHGKPTGDGGMAAQQLANSIRAFPLRFSGVRADGQASWNFSLLKNFKLAERLAAQFRIEAYNTMNHPSFDVPNTTTTNTAFGSSTAVVSEPRNFQFALKLMF